MYIRIRHISEALKILVASKSQEDIVFRNQVMPKLEEDSVVVLDKATYHCRIAGKCLSIFLNFLGHRSAFHLYGYVTKICLEISKLTIIS